MAAKVFVVGDVLPATTQLRISWDEITASSFTNNDYKRIRSEEDNYFVVNEYIDMGDEIVRTFNINGVQVWSNRFQWTSPYTDTNGNHAYIDIDTSTWNLSQRTITRVDSDLVINALKWEDLAPAPSGYSITFEENGGTSVTDLTEQTALPDPLPATTKANNVFAGWYYDALFTQKANAGDALESNVTLYAKWYSVSGWFSDVADAIRTKDGTAETIEVVEFPDRIEALPSPKEEETKTVTPTTSSQDVLPDANKVLSKVTVNAIPTETKSATPSLGSGDQIIYQTSGKYMTAFTIVKDLTNHIAANIRYGKTLYGVAGSLVEGIDTSDANATSSSIHDGKTAYVNGSKITGTADLGVELTQTAYDNLNTKDSNTYYLIIEES